MLLMPERGHKNNMVLTYSAGVVLVYFELVPLLAYSVGNQSQTVVVLVAGCSCSFVSGICILSFLLSAAVVVVVDSDDELL